MTASVKVSGLRKTFTGGSVVAVDGIDFEVQPGEVVAFLGPNGAGKTTTLDIVLGLNEPSSGTVQVLGGSPRQAIKAGRMGALLQTGGLLNDMKVGETVDYIAATFPGKTEGRKVLETAGIANLASRKVGKCSGGEQQKLKSALALLTNPDVLVLDEPTTGMDVGARRTFWATMHSEAREGRTIIFATHYLEEAQDFANRIVLINKGKIVADGATEEIRALAGVKQLSAKADNPAGTLAALAAVLPDAASSSENGRIKVHTADSDAAARWLLAQPGVHDLEIVTPSLDDAFVALTEDGDEK